MTKRRICSSIALLLVAGGYFAYAVLLKPRTDDGVATHIATAAAIPANAREFTLGTLAFKVLRAGTEAFGCNDCGVLRTVFGAGES